MNYSKIFCIVLAANTFSINGATSNFNKELISDVFIPFELEISLDFLQMQIKDNQDLLQNDWNGIPSKNIIKKAESIVKNSPKDFTNVIKTKIIDFFKEIDIDIIFTKDNMIIKDVKDFKIILKNKTSQEEKEERLIQEKIIAQQKYKELHPDTTDHTHSKPHKIHGARRTMNRLKKRYANQEAKEKKRHNDLLDAIHKHLEKRNQNAKSSLKKAANKTPKETNFSDNSANTINSKENDQKRESSNVRTTKQTFNRPQKPKTYRPLEDQEKPHYFTLDPMLNES